MCCVEWKKTERKLMDLELHANNMDRRLSDMEKEKEKEKEHFSTISIVNLGVFYFLVGGMGGAVYMTIKSVLFD